MSNGNIRQIGCCPLLLPTKEIYADLLKRSLKQASDRRRVTSEDNRNLFVLIPLPEMKFNHSPAAGRSDGPEQPINARYEQSPKNHTPENEK